MASRHMAVIGASRDPLKPGSLLLKLLEDTGYEGKVAGVMINTNSGAPGASTKVIIRGYSSIGGNNNPLYLR